MSIGMFKRSDGTSFGSFRVFEVNGDFYWTPLYPAGGVPWGPFASEDKARAHAQTIAQFHQGFSDSRHAQ